MDYLVNVFEGTVAHYDALRTKLFSPALLKSEKIILPLFPIGNSAVLRFSDSLFMLRISIFSGCHTYWYKVRYLVLALLLSFPLDA